MFPPVYTNNLLVILFCQNKIPLVLIIDGIGNKKLHPRYLFSTELYIQLYKLNYMELFKL